MTALALVLIALGAGNVWSGMTGAPLLPELRAVLAGGRSFTAKAGEKWTGGGGGGGWGPAGVQPAVSRPTSGGYVMPAAGPITSGYGPRGGRLHAGLDIGVPIGSPVMAARAGTVSFVGARGDYGNTVDVDHGGGHSTRYAHLMRAEVLPGQLVQLGQVIARSGNTGRSSGPHLHFEVRIGGVPVNPASYVGGASSGPAAAASGTVHA